jgi:glycerol-3-phosphate acyltransferase PlsX
MAVGLRLQADGQSDAFVSAGNTGAQMVASMMILRMHAGLERPAIVTLFPSARKPVAVLDSGANVDCGAEELVQFARLGATYVECMLGRSNPAVGLLSIGEEPEKGNAVTKEAHQLLQSAGLNFIGNVEGRDLPAGGTERDAVDVVVCDGFVGNVALKAVEGVAGFFKIVLTTELKRNPITMLGAAIANSALKRIRQRLNPARYNGASLLGLRGLVFKSHGGAEAEAYEWAIRRAYDAAKNDVQQQLADLIAELMPRENTTIG